MNNNLFKSRQLSRAVATVSPNLLKIRFCSVQYRCTRYLDVAMRYLDVTKGVG